MSEMRPWTRAILDMVWAGETDRERVMQEAMKLVPPAVAVRRHQAMFGKPRGVRPECDPVATGRRIAVRSSIGNLRHGGWIEVDGSTIRALKEAQ